MPQLTIRSGAIRAQSWSDGTGPPPSSCSTAVPLTSMPCGVHGVRLARSSLTIATRGCGTRGTA